METTVEVGRIRRTLALLGWLVGLSAVIVGFHALGSGSLAAPPLWADGWSAWAQERDPLVATIAVLRVVVLALAWYLVAVTFLGLAARLCKLARLITVAEAITVPALRGFLRNTLGVSLATAMIVTAPAASAIGARAHAASSTHVTEVLPVQLATGGSDLDGDGPVLHSLDEPLPLEIASDPDRRTEDLRDRARQLAPTGGGVPSAQPQGPTSAGSRQPGGPADSVDAEVVDAEVVDAEVGDVVTSGAAGPRTVTVEPGDSLWSIARDALDEATEGSPSEAVIAAYWSELVERNRAELPDPGNPDLIFPGDEIVLPGVPSGAEQGS